MAEEDIIVPIQRVLPTLSSSTRYVARVRAFTKLGVPSDWSEALVFDTPADNSTPGGPRNLQINFETGTLFLDWDPPINNTDGTLVVDLSHYIVLLADGEDSVQYETKNSFYAYSFEKNVADFVTARPNLDVSIFAVDVSGNVSAPATGVAINPPPQDPPAAPRLGSAFTLISVDMSPDPVDRDIAEYLLYHSTNDVSYSLLAVSGGSYVHEVAQSSTHYYKFKVRDLFGQESDFSPVSTTSTEDAGGEDLTPPSQVQDFTASADDGAGTFYIDPVSKRPYIDTTWTPNSGDTNLSHYEIVLKLEGQNGFVDYIQVPPQESTYRITNLQENTQYRVFLYAYSNNGVRSAPSDNVVVTTGYYQIPPNVPTGFKTTTGIGSITASWDPHPDFHFQNFELYASTDFEDIYGTGATPIEEPDESFRVFVGNATSYVQQTSAPNETWYFRIRAAGRNGLKSSFVPTNGNEDDFKGTSADSFDTEPPDVPTGVSLSSDSDAAQGTSYIDVSWNAVGSAGLAGYMVRLAPFGQTNYEYKVVHSDTTSARFSGLTPGVVYFAQVASFNSSGSYSAFSSSATETAATDSSAPPLLDNAFLRAGIRSILLEWDASLVPDFSHYKIYIGTTENFTPDDNTNLYDTPGVGTIAKLDKFWDDSLPTPAWADLVPGTRYYVKLRAVDISGNHGQPVDAYDADSPTEKGVVVGRAGDNDIEELYIDKLRSGELTAAVLLSGQIRTANSGARMEIDSGGIIGYALNGATPNFEYTNVDVPERGLAAGDVRIRGGIESGSYIRIGSEPNVFAVDQSGFMWFGAEDFVDAPFRVSNEGQVRASDITLVGHATPNSGDLLINSNNFVVTQGGDVIANNITANGGMIAGASIQETVVGTLADAIVIPSGGLSGAVVSLEDVTGFDAAGTFVLAGYAFSYTGADVANNQLTGVSGGVESTIPDETLVYQGGLSGGLFTAPNILIPTGGGIQFVGDGNITWGENAAGKIIVGGLGEMRSGNYDFNLKEGWRLGPEGLTIFDGTIAGANIQIGVSNENLFVNSSFENGVDTRLPADEGVADNWFAYTGNATAEFEISQEEVRFQAHSQKITVLTTSGGTSRVGVYQDVLPDDGTFPAGTPVATSFYVLQGNTGGGVLPRSATAVVYTVLPNTSEELVWFGEVTDIDSLEDWQRISTRFSVDDGEEYDNFRVYLWFNDIAVGDEFYIDGGQIHLSDFVSPYAPRTLDIPANYIQDVHIGTVSADKIRTGFIGPTGNQGSVDVVIGPLGTITSFNYDTNAGFQIRNDRMVFQNGAIEIFAGGNGGDPGYVKIDGQGIQSIYGGNTKFKVNADGVFIGGNTEADASFYWDPDTNNTRFQSSDSSYEFNINLDGIADPDGNDQDRVLQLKDALDTENFYLTKEGLAYFKGGVIGLGGGQGFHVDNVGNLWVGNSNRELAPLAIYAAGDIFLRSKAIKVLNDADAYIGTQDYIDSGGTSGWMIQGDGDAYFNSGEFRGDIYAQNGTFGGSLVAADGTFAGDLIAGGKIIGRDIEGGTITGAVIQTSAPGYSTARIVIEQDDNPTDDFERSRIQFFSRGSDGESKSHVIHAVRQGENHYFNLVKAGVSPSEHDEVAVPIPDDGLLVRSGKRLYLEGEGINLLSRDMNGRFNTDMTFTGRNIRIQSIAAPEGNSTKPPYPRGTVTLKGDFVDIDTARLRSINGYTNIHTGGWYIEEVPDEQSGQEDYKELIFDTTRKNAPFNYLMESSSAARFVEPLDGSPNPYHPIAVGYSAVTGGYGGRLTIEQAEERLEKLDDAGFRIGTSTRYAREDHKHAVFGTGHTHESQYAEIDHGDHAQPAQSPPGVVSTGLSTQQLIGNSTQFFARADHTHNFDGSVGDGEGPGSTVSTLKVTSDASTAMDARLGGVRGGTFFVHSQDQTTAIMGPLAPHYLFLRSTTSGGPGLLWHGGEIRVISNSGNENAYHQLRGVLVNQSSIESKKNVKTITNAILDDIAKMRVVEFDFKTGPTGKRLGIIAEEVELIDNRIAHDGGLRTDALASLAIKGIQELTERVKALEERVRNGY